MSIEDEILYFACEGHNIFLTGEAGSGKSTLINKIFEVLTSIQKQCAIVALTGIASQPYGGGG